MWLQECQTQRRPVYLSHSLANSVRLFRKASQSSGNSSLILSSGSAPGGGGGAGFGDGRERVLGIAVGARSDRDQSRNSRAAFGCGPLVGMPQVSGVAGIPSGGMLNPTGAPFFFHSR